MEDIQVRATTIRTYDNRRAVIPNSALFGDKVLVNTAYDKRRLRVRVGVGYDDIARAKHIILDAIRGCIDVVFGLPPRPSGAPGPGLPTISGHQGPCADIGGPCRLSDEAYMNHPGPLHGRCA